ncbi:hypothetical protein D3C72_309410 [compost metagenome]
MDLGLGRGRRAGAVVAQTPDQTLTRHATHDVGQQIVFNPQVQQTRDGGEGRIGVDGRDDHVARQCGLDGDSRRFGVADFADHDDVGVLTQDGAQTSGEGQAYLGAHAYLNHAGQVQFDRVLDRDDLALAVVQVGQ